MTALTEEIRRAAKELADQAPPLTAEQRETIRTILAAPLNSDRGGCREGEQGLGTKNTGR